MSDKHSPLPFSIEKGYKNIIIDNNGLFVGSIVVENINFILESCNNYEALQTNYNNLLQQYEGQAAALAEINKQLDAVKEIFPDLLNLISSHGVDDAITAIDNALSMPELPEFNEWMEAERETVSR